MVTPEQKKSSGHGEVSAFELKGNVAPLTVLRLLSDRLELVDRQLGVKVNQLPHFFLHAPVVIDIGALEQKDDFSSFKAMADILRRHKLVPVAVRNVNTEQQQQAFEAGFGLLQGELSKHLRKDSAKSSAESGGQKSEMSDVASSPATGRSAGSADPGRSDANHGEVASDTLAVENAPQNSSMLISQPVRGGQIVYAHQRDLVVLASVNAGAEVIGDGHIHIYAPLRGRALAGALGNEEAHIFCSVLNAELVGIAGKYLLADEIPSEFNGKPVHIHIEKDKLVIEKLT